MIETRFKKTDIGEVPEDWDIKALGEIGEPKMCKRIMKFQTKEVGDIPFYKIGTFGNTPDAFISKELFEDYKCKFSFPQKGEILISAAGTIGRAIIYNGEDSYYQDSNIVWIDNNERIVLNKFLFNIYKIVEWDTNTGTIPRLYNDNLKRTLIQFPPIAEQQRIATALSDIDALLSALNKKIEKKKLVKQGAMQQLLTGKKRLAGFTEPWMEKKLGDISLIKTGCKNGNEAVENGKYPFFVRSQTVYRINSYSFDGEAIIIPGEGGIGTIFHYINGKFDYHQRVYKISNFPDNIYAKYIYFYIKQYFGDYAINLSVKATVDSLRLSTFSNFVLCIPSSKSEQTAIATILSDMDKEIEQLEAKRAKYEQVKQGMMQQLLTGKIRLIDE